MLNGKSVSGWVLAMVALSLFAILLLRSSPNEEPTSPPAEQVTAGMVVPAAPRANALDFSAAFEAVSAQYTPVVVRIFSKSFQQAPLQPLGYPTIREDFSATKSSRSPQTQASHEAVAGCGVLVSSDGYILTNYHLLAQPPSGHVASDSVTVVWNNGKQANGVVIGTDLLTDLALIKIAAKGLPAARWGNSDRLKVGQWVMAVGGAAEHAQSVTAGIISAKGRSNVAAPQLDDFIRLDASMNPGNSGGALVNLEGELVGINTVLFAAPGQAPARNNGYAIPSNLVRRIMQSLIKEGKVTRGFIGVETQDLDQTLAKALHLDNTMGALIVAVTPESPAHQAGVQRGDVILQFAGEPVRHSKELQNRIALQPPGQMVPVVVWRDSVKIACDLSPVAQPTPEIVELAAIPSTKSANKLGVHVQSLSSSARRQSLRGVVISQIDSNSPAAQSLSVGDVIQEFNRRTINNAQDFQVALRQIQPGQAALLFVRRDQQTFFVGVEAR